MTIHDIRVMRWWRNSEKESTRVENRPACHVAARYGRIFSCQPDNVPPISLPHRLTCYVVKLKAYKHL